MVRVNVRKGIFQVLSFKNNDHVRYNIAINEGHKTNEKIFSSKKESDISVGITTGSEYGE